MPTPPYDQNGASAGRERSSSTRQNSKRRGRQAAGLGLGREIGKRDLGKEMQRQSVAPARPVAPGRQRRQPAEPGARPLPGQIGRAQRERPGRRLGRALRRARKPCPLRGEPGAGIDALPARIGAPAPRPEQPADPVQHQPPSGGQAAAPPALSRCPFSGLRAFGAPSCRRNRAASRRSRSGIGAHRPVSVCNGIQISTSPLERLPALGQEPRSDTLLIPWEAKR